MANIRSEILKLHFDKLGLDDSFFANYESETTDRLQNLDKLLESLRDAYLNNRKIVVYTDFDVDGIMSSIIAYAGLSQLGFNVSLFKPSPSNGYGMFISDIDALLSEFPDAEIILTGDVGITNNDVISYAKGRNLKVFVTDHHDSTQECVADVAVNPNQFGETYSHNKICGSYVIYKVLHEYCMKYTDPVTVSDIYRLQLFAGIATISDSMPLLYENRQLVRNSISIMRYFYNYKITNNTIAPPVCSKVYSSAFVGVNTLLRYFERNNKIKTTDDIDEQFFGYYFVPFLNSCKRMEGDMSGIYDIFFSDNIEPLPEHPNMTCMTTAINYIASLNEKRKYLTNKYFTEICAIREDENSRNAYRPLMYREVYVVSDAPSGLLGLLATKLISLSNMPTLVLRLNSDGSYSGSGRNPSWFDFDVETKKHKINITTAGHKNAAFGVSFPNYTELMKYSSFFDKVVIPMEKQYLSVSSTIYSCLKIANTYGVESYVDDCDFVLDTEQIRTYLIELNSYRPFGKDFPQPEFSFCLDDNVTVIMFGKQKQHIRIITSDGIEVMLFNQALDFEKLKYDNRGKDFKFLCHGYFKFDTFDNSEFDTISFFASSIDVVVKN